MQFVRHELAGVAGDFLEAAILLLTFPRDA